MEKQLEVLKGKLRQVLGTKSRLERQIDSLDINDSYYDRKILDLQRRYDEQYGQMEEIESQIRMRFTDFASSLLRNFSDFLEYLIII